MKKLVFTMIAAMSMTFAMAQTTDDNKAKKQFAPVDRTEMMTSKLGLSKKQAAKVKELNEQYKDVLEHRGHKFHGPNGFGPQGPCPQMMDSAPQNVKDCKELTAEDKAKFEAKMKENQARRQEYEQKLKELNEQYKDVLEHGPKFGHKGRKGRGFKNQGANCNCCQGNAPQGPKPLPQLSEEDKAKIKAEMKEKKAKRQEYEQKLKEILSDSQYAEYQKMQPKHHGKKH